MIDKPLHEILVVEDEPLLLMLLGETFRNAGYTVWEAQNGEIAFAILKKEPGIDFLLTDIKMPGMNGYQLVDASLAFRPELKVMLMTGYTQDPLPKKISDAGIPLLQKPFDFEALPKLVEESLSRS